MTARDPTRPGTTAEPATRVGSRRPYRILALDGGPMALLVVRFLRRLEGRHPGFLDSVDLFAGTSSGAMTALILASGYSPARRLTEAERFWRDAGRMSRNSLFGYAKALAGWGALFDNGYTLAALREPAVLGDATLGDLPRGVAAVSFEVSPATPDRGWRPRVFTNIHETRPEDRALAAADVALRSSSSPLVLPIHRGSVDGGVVANNPSMAALVAALRAARDDGRTLDVEDIALLSVGLAGRRLPVRNGDWGYLQWLFDPRHPLALFDMLLSAGGAGADGEVAALLPDGRFHRVGLRPIGATTRPLALQHSPVLSDLSHDTRENRAHADRTAEWAAGHAPSRPRRSLP